MDRPRSRRPNARTEEERRQYRKEATYRWRAKHPDQARAGRQRRDWKKRYGITPEQYDEMLESQGGVCAICGGTNPGGHQLAVDHDHETGAVRGLLCHACNSGLGKLRDSVERLESAIQYLTKE